MPGSFGGSVKLGKVGIATGVVTLLTSGAGPASTGAFFAGSGGGSFELGPASAGAAASITQNHASRCMSAMLSGLAEIERRDLRQPPRAVLVAREHELRDDAVAFVREHRERAVRRGVVAIPRARAL